MIVRTLIGLLMVLMSCSSNQQASQEKQQEEQDSKSFTSKSGLLIDSGINRGVNYTDSLGKSYNLRYIPITIRLAFAQSYDYPKGHGEEPFMILPMPTTWVQYGRDITESMYDKLEPNIADPSFSKILQPGEKLLTGIGTLYPRPPKTTGVLPRALFAHLDERIFPSCDGHMPKATASQAQLPLGLKIIFGADCRVIPCGHISYLNP
jgi:hypothetical protein